uniref:Uncharacterized protein n=1 Tax=Glossina austeni TaxID=7395 RepID=A0A1A9UW40_GLOAU
MWYAEVYKRLCVFNTKHPYDICWNIEICEEQNKQASPHCKAFGQFVGIFYAHTFGWMWVVALIDCISSKTELPGTNTKFIKILLTGLKRPLMRSGSGVCLRAPTQRGRLIAMALATALAPRPKR